jgi:hypothetical protein
MKPQIAEIDCSTGETIIREMNDEEYAQHLIDVAAWEAEQAEKALENASE